MNPQKTEALKRLHRDYEELQNLNLTTIAAAPLERNYFEWHANILAPYTSDYRGIVMHCEIKFPENYPQRPPRISLKSNYLSHSHVYGDWICLDLLETHRSEEKHFGWSSAYSVSSILLQLQSFLFEEEHLVQFLEIKKEIMESNDYICSGCTHNAPQFEYWPWKDSWSKKVTFAHPGHCELVPGKRMPDQRRFRAASSARMRSSRRGGRRSSSNNSSGADDRREHFAKVTQRLSHVARCERMRQVLRRRNNPRWKKMSHEEIEAIFSQELEENRMKQERERQRRIEAQRVREQKEKEDRIVLKKRLNDLRGWDNPDVVWCITQFLNQGDLSILCQGINTRWASVAHKQVVYTRVREEVKCFYTKASISEDVLGVGINITPFKNDESKIQYASTPLHLLSYHAYKSLGVRKSVWNESFKYWIPLILSSQHAEKAWPLLESSIAKMYRTFKPEYILDFVTKLMNSMIVAVMEGSTHASCTALEGYMHCHRILVEALLRYPELKKTIDQTLKDFIFNEEHRVKKFCPSIGDLLPLISVSSYSWSDLSKAVVDETRDRNALWILKKYPDLDSLSTGIRKPERIEKAFDACQVSLRLLAYHQVFLTEVAPPTQATLEEIAAASDESYGRPLPRAIERFQKTIFGIQKLSTYEDALEFLGYDKEELTTDLVNDMLLQSFKNSARKGYHRSVHCLKLTDLPDNTQPLQIYSQVANYAPVQSIHVLPRNTAILRFSANRYKEDLLRAIENGRLGTWTATARCGPYHTPKFSDTTNRIFVRGCSNKDVLERVFGKCGKILDCICIADKNFSFVTFDDKSSVEEALLLDGHPADFGTYVRVSEAKTPPNAKAVRKEKKREPFAKEEGWETVRGKTHGRSRGGRGGRWRRK